MIKKLKTETKAIIFAILSLITFVMFLSSLAMLIDDYLFITAVILCFSYVLTFVFVFISNVYSNNYKWKYLVLGKEFKRQKENFFKTHNNFSKKEKRKIIKTMKHHFRMYGTIKYSVSTHIQTPYKNFFEDNQAFNYGNALDKQKIEYLIYAMHLNCDFVDEIFNFFEFIKIEPFTYEEYENLIKNCNLLSENLKNDLLNDNNKEIFEFFKKENLSEDEISAFYKKHEEDENPLKKYSSEIDSLVEKIAIENYLFINQKTSIPDNTYHIFISNDGYKRFCIFHDKLSSSYMVAKSEFVFITEDNESIKDCEGQWITTTLSSHYETPILAISDMKNDLYSYTEISVIN
ncbi:MAG: hypothetical protein IJX17_03160 [Clostridia bacterium]|nr:hypothetical protein [Clostridia bacterium]